MTIQANALEQLLAISPLEVPYDSTLAYPTQIAPEFGLIKYRLQVEIP